MLKVNFSPPLIVGILKVIMFTFDFLFFTCDMQPYIFTGYHEEKLEDKHLCPSLFLIKPLVTTLIRFGPTSKKTLVTKYCQIFSWNLSFLLLCLKTKEKIKVKSSKGYILRNVFHL